VLQEAAAAFATVVRVRFHQTYTGSHLLLRPAWDCSVLMTLQLARRSRERIAEESRQHPIPLKGA
jgi:hypothetical protein